MKQSHHMKIAQCSFGKVFLAICLGSSLVACAQKAQPKTYANPMDLNYRFQLNQPSRRESADPTMVVFKGEYWLFASKSGGYWRSSDMRHWKLSKPVGLPTEYYAPTVVAINGRLHFTASNLKGIWSTDDPGKGVWTKDAEIPSYGDPDLFLDDDGRLYMYNGSSNKDPLMVTELDPKHGFKPMRTALINASRDPEHRGFEIAGDNNDKKSQSNWDPSYTTWIEGSWMTKRGGKYYLQYATPGTQFKTYADGVLVGDSPMGPFHSPAYSPLSFKPTGFIAGAGHGSTFQDLQGRWWHIATMTISVRKIFERRLGLFPVRFTSDGQMVEDTYLSDYPHRWGGNRGLAGWMLLSYRKPVTASSVLDEHPPQMAVDENIRDWWSAKTGNAGEWLTVDLGGTQTIRAVQINFGDEGSTALGASNDTYRYVLEGSIDGKHWSVLVDHRTVGRNAPDDYEELTRVAHARFVRITNEHMPNGAKFSLSGLRIFGQGHGESPKRVRGISVKRSAKSPNDGRIAEVSWQSSPGAEFYIIRYGIAPNRLLGSYQIYNATKKEIRSLNVGVRYFFTVDAVNAAGISKGTKTVTLAP